MTGSISTGALVTGINECPVTSAATWATCLQSMCVPCTHALGGRPAPPAWTNSLARSLACSLHQDLGTNPGFCTPETYIAGASLFSHRIAAAPRRPNPHALSGVV